MPNHIMMSISAVERDTGLSKDTLRVWEKRYGFPNPERDHQGERCYPLEQVERLRLIKRLLDVGHRPGRVVALSNDDLQTLAQHSAEGLAARPTPQASAPKVAGLAGEMAPARPTDLSAALSQTHVAHGHAGPATWGQASAWVDEGLRFADAHDVTGLKRMLLQALAHLGLSRFSLEVATPLQQAMGEGWLRGRFLVPQEHWVSHCLQQVLHSAIVALPLARPEHAPRVLLSTFPGEPHTLGLLMVEAWLALLETQPVNLGPQTPVWDLVNAAQSHRADVVALSFSASAPATLVQDTLPDLRAKLPEHIELWAGGRHPLLQRRTPPGVRVLEDVGSLHAAVHVWRATQQPPSQRAG